MTDTAHLFSDIVGFLISYLSIWLAIKPATSTHSFGFHRAEIIGTLGSVLLIQGLTIWLFKEAVDRVYNPTQIEPLIMLVTAVLGLLFNIIQITMLHHGHHHGHDHGHSHGHHHHHHEDKARGELPHKG